jgi:hypothetical protein
MSVVPKVSGGKLHGTILDSTPSPELASFAIFDKVINLKFYRQDKDDDFIIRSDYEIYKDANGKAFFAKCVQKPEIKVEYKQMSGEVSIDVFIHVTNLHLVTPVDSQRIDSAFDNPVKFIKVQLGYFQNFPKFDSPTSNLTTEDYYDLLDQRPSKGSYQEFTAQVLAAYPSKLPPDGVTTFRCVIGNAAGVAAGVPKKDVEKFEKGLSIEKWFYDVITRRYLAKWPSTGERGLAALTDASDAGTFMASEDGVELRYSGRLTTGAADKYGVQIICSDMIVKNGFKDASGKEMPVLPRVPTFNSVNATLAYIQKIFPYMRYYVLMDGSFLIYHTRETAGDISAALLAKKRLAPLTGLPAIYSITYSGTRTIQCPFTVLVQPFQQVQFNSRYNVGSLVSFFFQPEAGAVNTFFVVNFSVKFSTTGEENMIEIMGVDKAPESGG